MIRGSNVLPFSNTSVYPLCSRFITQYICPQQLEGLVAYAHANQIKLRPVGSAASPNGLGLSSEGMVSMRNCDRILHVDVEKVGVHVYIV